MEKKKKNFQSTPGHICCPFLGHQFIVPHRPKQNTNSFVLSRKRSSVINSHKYRHEIKITSSVDFPSSSWLSTVDGNVHLIYLSINPSVLDQTVGGCLPGFSRELREFGITVTSQSTIDGKRFRKRTLSVGENPTVFIAGDFFPSDITSNPLHLFSIRRIIYHDFSRQKGDRC